MKPAPIRVIARGQRRSTVKLLALYQKLSAMTPEHQIRVGRLIAGLSAAEELLRERGIAQ